MKTKKTLRIAAGQINTTVGDIIKNCDKAAEYISKAQSMQADIISLPELAVTGYPPEDLVLNPGFISDNLDALARLQKEVGDVVAVVGFVDRDSRGVYNAAAIMHRGKTIGVYRKFHLPNYGVFDEKRHFLPGRKSDIFQLGETAVGITICEDMWHPRGPLQKHVRNGAKIIININASPYHTGKPEGREKLVKKICIKNAIHLCYTNLVGGQDELVFDGGSFIMEPDGKTAAVAAPFEESLLAADIFTHTTPRKAKGFISIPAKLTRNSPIKTDVPVRAKTGIEGEIYLALTTGLRDYMSKNGFAKAVLGVSGGIDSALVAAIACDAIGSDNVTGISMPSRYTSKESCEDAIELSGRLKIKLMEIPINSIFDKYTENLNPFLDNGKTGHIAYENIQARVRGNILMAFSNSTGCIVLTTGNKSEISVGYSTLYGDMAGGFAVIKDVYKTMVYKLAGYRNSSGIVIPERILTKPPSAELKPGQKDQDTLPPYPLLDAILKEYIEKDKSYNCILKQGFDTTTVKRVIAMVDRNEYKRRQAPPGIKITAKALGRDRRLPITNLYRPWQ